MTDRAVQDCSVRYSYGHSTRRRKVATVPLWTIHHNAECLNVEDRRALAADITGLYSGLPRFYVGVVYVEAGPDTLFVGGVTPRRFVRVGVDQIARTLPDAAAREWWIDKVNRRLAPFMSQRELDWELHIDETSRDLWLIQGMRPPMPGSPGETLWRDRAEPVPYE